jgi:uncharacterized radical SAM superfamily Fe-S cluster-containing enzyme
VSTAEATGPGPRTDRHEVFLEYTKSICPVCKVVVDAEVNIRDDQVFIRKRCPTHGPFEALLYSDAQMYVASLRYNKPGTLPLATKPRPSRAARSTAGCALTTSSTPALASSRSTAGATWTARSASPTPAANPTGSR